MELVTTEKIPVHALCYLEYGLEASYDMTEEEIQYLDNWLETNFPNGYMCDFHYDQYFTNYPLFGLPCDVCDVDFYSC